MPRRNLQRLALILAALVPVLFVAGIWLGGHPSSLPEPLQDLLVDDQTATFDEALDVIEHDYYRKIDRDRIVDDSLAGAVSRLHDRFSTYMSPADYRHYLDASRGEFSGVGMEVVEVRQGLRVSRVYPKSPAQKAGIARGDVILAVNGRSIAGLSSDRTTALIRGRPGSKVTLAWDHQGQRITRRMERAKVTAPAVTSSLRTRDGVKLGVVALSGFTSGAHGEVRRAVDRLLDRGAKGIVLDLRGNGGGIIDEAVFVASVFIPDGTIVSTDGRNRDRRVYRASGGAIARRIAVDVLVDPDTASASEIVAGAIQDRKRGEVVGTRTFGKGVFQEVRGLRNGGALDITVGEYFLPSGRNLGGGGIRRGAGIKPDQPARDDPRTPADEALQAALRVLAAQAR
jgi:carboxyl-terminal processing protease